MRNRTQNSFLLLLLCSLGASAQTPAAPANLGKAAQAFDAGRYAEALDLFQRAQAESPRCEVHFYIGLAQYRLKRVDDAITSFGSALGCNPQFALAQRALGDAYLTKGDDNRALGAYESSLKLQPDDLETLRAAALLCLKHGLAARALPLLERLVQLQPNDADMRVELAGVYGGAAQFKKAEEQFRAALSLQPQNPAALLGLGGLYLKDHRTEQAVPLLKKAAELAPGTAKPLYLLGWAYNWLGRYSEAVAALEQAASRAPQDAEIYYQLAHAYGHLQKVAEKKKAMDRFFEIKNQTQRSFEAQREAARLVGKVQVAVDQGNLTSALEMAERAHELDPDNEEVLFRLASLYYDTEKYVPARDYAERLVARAPSDWRYRYLLGLAQMATNQLEQAQANLGQVVRLNPGMAEAYNELGNLAMKRKQLGQALKAYEQAVKTDPKNAVYKLNLEAAHKAATGNN